MDHIAFFHVGADTACAEIFCASVKAAYQKSSVCLIHITDSQSPSLDNVDKRIEIKGLPLDSIMYARMLAYGAASDLINKPIAFLDTDMLLIQQLGIPIDGGFKTVLCRRSFNRNAPLNSQLETVHGLIEFKEHCNKNIDSVYPYLGCFIISHGSEFWKIAISIYSDLPSHYKKWYGDQVAIREAAKRISCVEALEREVACLPEALSYLKPESIKVVHYKGNRKRLMGDHLSLLLAIRASDN